VRGSLVAKDVRRIEGRLCRLLEEELAAAAFDAPREQCAAVLACSGTWLRSGSDGAT
jgi:hypothetical protein